MEAGINGASRPLPQRSKGDEGDDLHNSNSTSYTNARPPQTSSKGPISTINTRSTRPNGYDGRRAGVVADSDDPADFYRDYLGTASTRSRSDITVASNSGGSQEQPPSSLRSNGNGTTPKHPSISANRADRKPLPNRSTLLPQKDSKIALNAPKSTPNLNGYPRQTVQTGRVKEIVGKFDPQDKKPATNPRRTAGPFRTPGSTSDTNPVRERTPVEKRRPTGTTRVISGARDDVGGGSNVKPEIIGQQSNMASTASRRPNAD